MHIHSPQYHAEPLAALVCVSERAKRLTEMPLTGVLSTLLFLANSKYSLIAVISTNHKR